MNLAAKAIDLLANPARVSNVDKLRSAVSGKTVLVTGASYHRPGCRAVGGQAA